MPKEDVLRSLVLLAAYFLFAGVGVGIAFWISGGGPQPEHRAAALTGFTLAWILYGALWLMRVVPRYQQPPAWLIKTWSGPDWTLLALMACALLYAAFA